MISYPTQTNLKINIPSIIKYMVIGFLALLVLIWLIATVSQNKLEQLKIHASENSKAYLERIELATAIREAAANVLAQARLYRAARDLRVAGIAYRFNLNKSKYNLEKLLKRGDQLWGSPSSVLPKTEIAAWKEIEGAVDDLWMLIETEDADPQNSGEDFYEKRSAMEQAAIKLARAISNSRDKVLEDIAALQATAATDVRVARLVTLLFGILVAAFTINHTRKQLIKTRDAERRVQEEQGQKGAVFDSLTDDIFVLSETGEVLEVNSAFLDHFKLSNSELKLQDYRAALAQVPEISSFVDQAVRNPDFNQKQRERIEVKFLNGENVNNLYDVSISPLIVGSETAGRVIVMDDVTEDERVREELRRSRTLSAVGQITAQVAHEIYNPLGAVKLNLDLLEMQSGYDEDIKHTIGRIKRGVDHLSTIAMDLRFLTSPREPDRRPTNLNDLLDEVIELASDRLERSRVVVKKSYAAGLPEGEYDPQQLRKVFLNLIINAIEASPTNGEMELKSSCISPGDAASIDDFDATDGAIRISVIDYGTGMSEETKNRIFEAFFTTKRNGTGLGMMITQEIIKKHNGRIEIESELEKGTKVDIYLPL